MRFARKRPFRMYMYVDFIFYVALHGGVVILTVDIHVYFVNYVCVISVLLA